MKKIKIIKLLYLLAGLLLILTQSITGKNYIVSSASDINTAMNTASPGDTLIMTAGEWVNQRIVFKGNGTENNHIVLKAEIPGLVILKGTSTLRIGGKYLTVDGLYFVDGYSSSGAVVEFRSGVNSQYCRLTNTAIVNYNPSSNSTDYKWISIYGQHNRVDHCYTYGKRHSGTTLVVWLDGQTSYHTIDSNYFAYRPELGVNGGETIRIGTSDYSQTDSYTLVEHNYFEHCNGEIEIISNKSGHNTFRYNTFYECEGTLTLRHGKYAEVYENYFIGNSKSNTGGVRIIDEDHKVYNNYFQDLRGSGFRSALTIMNGVPNSPLNRYFQVKRAEVVNNTFVNCTNNFNICAGADSERSLPPTDCKIANNIVLSNYQMINYDDDEPINMTYESNIMFGGPLGITKPEGIEMIDPELSESNDGLWRPASTSPIVNAGSENYSYIVEDFDGQQRMGGIDIGGDEISELPITNAPLADSSVGPSWYPPAEVPGKVIYVQAGIDSLLNAVSKISYKDTIELVTDGGVYSNSSPIEVSSLVNIRTADNLENRPTINQTNVEGSIFIMDERGELKLRGVNLDGMAGTSTPAKYLIRTTEDEMTKSYKLKLEDCFLHDVSVDGNGNFFRAYPGTFADTIIFNNCMFSNAGKEGIRLKDEDANSSKYNVEYFEVTNSTFWNIPREAINIYAGDEAIFTPGPKIVIDHSTFDNCGYEGTQIIYPKDCDGVEVTNSNFSNGDTNSNSISLYGFYANFEFNNIFNAGAVEVNGSVKLGDGIVNYDPIYSSSSTGDFTLPGNSPILNKANDKSTLGDPRWAVNPRTYYTIFETIVGEGNIYYSPESISKDYDPNSQVTLTANPAFGYNFYEWTGDISSLDSVLQISMDSDKSITATFTPVVSVENNSEIPSEYSLKQNYPNPFNPSTVIEYTIPNESHVKIEVYNLQGELVQTLVNSYKSLGNYKIIWQPSNLSSGLYLLRMQADLFNSSRKIIYMK